MINQSRRTLLKGMGYGMAALATGGVASTAMASAPHEVVNQSMQFVQPVGDITIYLQQTMGKEIVSLMNLTDQVIKLDSMNPVSLEHINGSLVVKINKDASGDLAIQPSERLAFEVDAMSYGADNDSGLSNVLANHVNIKSEHPAFNGRIAVMLSDVQFA